MNNLILYTTGALLLCLASFSQEKDHKLTKGDKLYDQYAYFESIAIYEKVANKGYKSTELFEKLGDAYFFNSDYSKANKWYTELFQLGGTIDPIYYYRYSQTLKSVGEGKKAEEYLQKFSKLNNTDARAMQYVGNQNYLAKIEDHSNVYSIEDAGVNTAFSDYGTAVYLDKILFSSSRMPEQGKNKKDSWTSDYYSSLYSASLSKEGTLSDVTFFAKEIQTAYHESSPVFTKDGKTIYFTRNNDQKRKANSTAPVLLKIYRANLVDGKWTGITELPFNSNIYSCAHPVLSPDEKTMYFASDMPGGHGDSDIYAVSIDNAKAIYGAPVNLGNTINTQGKETFPYVTNSDELYFASDGHLGLGGLDVFVINIKNGNFTSKVQNIGKPINSSFDDFCFVQLNNSNIGFFTSNREGGVGKDDIYRFTKKKVSDLIKIEGEVIDAETQLPITNAVVSIYDQNHNLISKVKSDANGRYVVEVNGKDSKGGKFYTKGEAPNYDTQETTGNIIDGNFEKVVTRLNKTRNSIDTGSDLAKKLNIKNILFDLDKHNIRYDAEVELQKIVQVMKDYPEIKIAIGAHTDSRQSVSYNMKLSDRRAKSTMNYLITNGIAKDRITAKGYGESQLLNSCADGVKCSEAEHQKNRRVEFIIVEK